MSSLHASSFHELLHALGAEHDREIRLFQVELAKRIDSSGIDTAGTFPTQELGDELCDAKIAEERSNNAFIRDVAQDDNTEPRGRTNQVDNRTNYDGSTRSTLEVRAVQESNSATRWSQAETAAQSRPRALATAASGPFATKLKRAVSKLEGCQSEESSSAVDANAFEVRQGWSELPSIISSGRPRVGTMGSLTLASAGHRRKPGERTSSTISLAIKGCCKHLYAAPGSLRRAIWDLLSMSILSYDLVTIPMRVFSIPSSQFTSGMAWVTQLFWNFDIVASFFVGYYYKGHLIMSPRRITFHYLRTWFLLDGTIVSVDWLLYYLGEGEESSAGIIRLVKTTRALRIFRSFRLLKFFKLSHMLEVLQRNFFDVFSKVHFGIAKLIMKLCFLSHLIACAWYSLGASDHLQSYGATWVTKFSVAGKNWGYCYTTSLHWTLAQLGMGTTSVEPANEFERIFAIIILFMAMLTFSSLVGSITNLISTLRKMKDDEAHQFWLLRRFCVEHKLSKSLQFRINEFLEYSLKTHSQKTLESSIAILQLLSGPLHAELQYELYSPCFVGHPFFGTFLSSGFMHSRRSGSSEVVQKICHEAIKVFALAREDVLFCVGDVATRMIIIQDGRADYIQSSGVTSVDDNFFVSEAALWTPWLHVGELQAVMESILVSLGASHVVELLSTQPEIWFLGAKYAEKAVLNLNSASEDEISDLSCRQTTSSQELEFWTDSNKDLAGIRGTWLTWLFGR